MVHDGLRVVQPGPQRLRSFPGLVDECRRQGREFRDPLPHVGSVGIELQALGHRVEDAEPGLRIATAARAPLPAGAVLGPVAVREPMQVVGLPQAVVQQQVLGQETRGHHAGPVVDEAFGHELARGGIHHGIACTALSPGLPGGSILPPGEPLEGGPEGPVQQSWPCPQQVVAKFAPQQFVEEGACTGATLLRHRAPDRADGEGSELQIRAQARGAGPVHAVAVEAIASQRRRQEGPEAHPARRLPARLEARIDGQSEGLHRRNRHGLRSHIRRNRRQALRFGQEIQSHPRRTDPGEGCEDAEHPTLSRPNRARRQQRFPLELFEGDAHPLQGLRHPPVPLPAEGLHPAVG